METEYNYNIRIATPDDYKYVTEIINELENSAAKRAINIAKRAPEYIIDKIDNRLAVVATDADTGQWVGFSCLEVWEHKKYVIATALIISPKYRNTGISRKIKNLLFQHYQESYPDATLFSITKSEAVICINKELGYIKVPNNEVLNDVLFLTGNNCLLNYTDLLRGETDYVAMIYEPNGISVKAYVRNKTVALQSMQMKYFASALDS
ncbi:MAG: hypothetical protein WC967_03000 [Balneolaceae bacterium]